MKSNIKILLTALIIALAVVYSMKPTISGFMEEKKEGFEENPGMWIGIGILAIVGGGAFLYAFLVMVGVIKLGT